MRTVQHIQTVIRLDPVVMSRVKRQAKREKVSFNGFVEKVLERATAPSFPKLPPDFKVSDDIRSMACFKMPEEPAELLEKDPKFAHLYEKYGK